MCGRFTLTADGKTLQLALALQDAPDVRARYNIAPSQPVGVVTNQQPNVLNQYPWGLIPSWAKDPAIANKLINARSETAHAKPSFRDAMRSRRCLVPADGYYEWQAAPNSKHKTPMYIFLDEHELFAFAGLWDVWQAPDGTEVRTCTLLTTDANDATRPIHHRMPVIIERANYEAWLHSDDERERRALLKPFTSKQVAFHPVAKTVNKPANDSPENIIPVDGGARQMTLL
jgi:putative SOS response-associated peptidase YedK